MLDMNHKGVKNSISRFYIGDTTGRDKDWAAIDNIILLSMQHAARLCKM